MKSPISRFLNGILAFIVLSSGGQVQTPSNKVLESRDAVLAGEALTIFPAQASSGAELFISGTGLLPNIGVDVVIYGAGLPDGVSLGAATTDDFGAFHLSVVLPSMASGLYTVAVNDRDLQPAIIFQVNDPPEIQLSQPFGPPGTIIDFIITNLLTGTLRLDYDGVPVFGPVEVNIGSYSNAWIVPKDRPANLGDFVTLKAVNLVNGRVNGTAETIFESMPIPTDQNFSLSQIVLPSKELSAGDTITVTGKIIPAPADASLYTLKLLWKTASGKIFPITSGYPLIQPNGSFLLFGEMPSLMNGAPAAVDLSAQVGIVLVKNGGEVVSTTAYTPFGVLKPLPKFIVKVVDQNNNPIKNAVVDIRAPYGAEAASSGSANYNTGALSQQNNQISQVLVNSLGGGVNDPFNCPSSGTYGRTDANGLFTFEFDPEKIALMGTKYLLEPTLNKYGQIPVEVVFPLNVNGLYAGYGYNGKVEAFHLDVRYKAFTREFYNETTKQKIFTEPYVVTLKALPPGTLLQIPAIPVIKGVSPFKVLQNFLGSGMPLYAFGNFLSFSNLFTYPNGIFSANSSIQLSFQHDSLAYGLLDETKMTFTLDGVVYNFQRVNGYKPVCGNNEYRANITTPYRLSTGAHIGTMAIKDMSGNTTTRYVQLTMTNPPAWFADTNLANRFVYYNPSSTAQGQTTMVADIIAQNSPSSLSEASATLNKVGPVENSASAYYHRSEVRFASGQSTYYFDGKMSAVAINQDKAVLIKAPGAGETKVTFSDNIVMLDTGRMPMFRDVWGVPPIASATIGADMWFNANLTYNGTITFGGPVGSSYSLLVNPSGTVGVDVFLDVSALFGIVSAHASAVPQISVSIPATFENGKKLDSTRCFKYKLDVHWEASIGYCPLCLSKSGTKNIFKGHQPTDVAAKYCSDPAAPEPDLAPSANPPPPDASPSIASDGFGHMLAVWRSDSGQIVSSSYNGITWSPHVTVSSNTSSGSPRVAFFAPNQAVAVWAQNGLTPAAAGTASFDTLARNQHLVYSVWLETVWSAPQNLTAPSTGDGSIVLAGCMSTSPGCPEGGAVTAAWVRDALGNLSMRRFDLLYATFSGGIWSVEQFVSASSSATDSESSLAYAGGELWIAWVRDADRNLGTLADHLLMIRNLSNGTPVQTAAGLPAGASQPSLAVDTQGRLALAFTISTEPLAFVSNKRQLYSALATCSPGCTWQYQALTDSHNRAVFGEGPVLTLNAADQAVITYRALGMGVLPNGMQVALAEDVPGVVVGTGAIAQLHVDFLNHSFTPNYLSSGLAPAWQLSAVFDPLTQQIVVAAAEGSPLVNLLGPVQNEHGQPQRVNQAEPVVFSFAPVQTDFALVTAAPSTFVPAPGDLLTITLRLNNQGAMPGRIGSIVTLAAAWDAPVGAGLDAGSLDVTGLDSAPAVTITLPVALPPSLGSPHHLYLTINPQQTLPEADYENNTQILTIGGMPVPQDLSASADPGNSLVILSWTALPDSRVAGYRIYRQNALGDVFVVGSSFTNGFADLTPVLDQAYWYMVTSFDVYGSESDYSLALKVELPANHLYLPAFVVSPNR